MHTGKLLSAQSQHTFILKFVGDVRLTLCSTLDQVLERIFADSEINTYIIDLTAAENLDSTTLGLIAKIAVHTSSKGLAQPSIISPNKDITLLLESMGFDQYFILLRSALTSPQELHEVPQFAGSEEYLKAQVLEAHRTLMAMNEQNKQAFQSVVQALEDSSEPSCLESNLQLTKR